MARRYVGCLCSRLMPSSRLLSGHRLWLPALTLATSACFLQPPLDSRPTTQPSAALRPCYIPRAEQFYFEREWLSKGRELDALKLGNALWWLNEASWNESLDAAEVYGPDLAIFGSLSIVPGTFDRTQIRSVRLLFLEEKEEPLAPVLLSLQLTPRGGSFYVKTLSHGKARDPGSGACWGGVILREERPLMNAQAEPVLACARRVMDERIRSEPWKLLTDEGRDTHYLLETQDSTHHGLAQLSRQVSNVDGVDIGRMRECVGMLLGLARKSTGIPLPETR